MKTGKLITIVLSALFIFIGAKIVGGGYKEYNRKLDEYQIVAQQVIALNASKFSEQEIYNEYQENGLDYENYWTAGSYAINAFINYRQTRNKSYLKSGEQILDNLQKTFERNGRFPRPEYNELEYGWVSSMDAPTVMVAAIYYDKLTRGKKYEVFITELEKYIISPIEEGGYNLSNENYEMWPMEYAPTYSPESRGNFVLNGSLTGYIFTLAASIYEDNRMLLDYCEKVERTYEEHFPAYHYQNQDYCFYMMNPITTNTLHYIMYEIRLLDTAYLLSEDSVFFEESNFRKEILQKLFKLEFSRKGENHQFVLNRAPAPHPYYIDIYWTKIQFMNQSGEIVKELIDKTFVTDKTQEFRDHMFLEGMVPGDAISYKVFSSMPPADDFLLSEGIITDSENTPVFEFEIRAKALDDAEYVGGSVVISPERTEDLDARLSFELPEPEEKIIGDIYALEITNLTDTELPVGIILYDTEGNGCGRYSMPLSEQKNLILFNYSGFHENGNIKNIKRIDLRIFTDNLEAGEYVIQPGRILKFNNNTSLYDYISNSEYKINPQLFVKH